MKILKGCIAVIVLLVVSISCGNESKEMESTQKEVQASEMENGDFQYKTEQFADLKILRYKVPGFDQLDLQQKKLAYYLYEAALSGRDIIWDQNFKHNLAIRRTLEAIVRHYEGDKNSEDFKNLMVYAKRVWFSNGIHHHYANDKFEPNFKRTYFEELVRSIDPSKLPLKDGQSVDELLSVISPIVFDPSIAAKKVNQNTEVDIVKESATNFYENVTRAEVDVFYDKIVGKKKEKPIEYGLNSKVVKENGQIKEKVWKVGGMYGPAIEQVVYWLEKAAGVAENDLQKSTIEKLIKYYKSGDLKDWDAYNIQWVQDTISQVDFINGFIEVYNDPRGYKGSFESVVSIKDREATKRIAAISKEAQWFEDNSPLIEEHKKKDVVGISAKVITVVVESGDASPSTPIGINLPNSNWVRKDHGSKSVNLGNIVHAYDMAAQEGASVTSEFAYSEEEIERTKKYGAIADILHTDMHEVIGHASGQLNPGIGTPKETLKSYASTLEEGRADLVALYYLPDPKLMEIGVVESEEVAKAGYDDYIRNGLVVQLTRLKLGDHIEEAHMRNRQMIAKWAYEMGKADNVIEKKVKDGKTYFVINDYEKLRDLFGQLLRETQRIKSEGDYEACKNLVENYGVKVDQELHAEVLNRFERLNLAPYGGFINPVLKPVEENGEIVDVKVEYPKDFTDQMLYYAEHYSFLPTYN